MSNVPKSKRSESGYQVVDTAITIYGKVLDICLRMPNRYTYLILQPIMILAGEVQDNVKKGNSIIPNKDNPNMVDIIERRKYFLAAHASLQALITRLNFFIDCPQTLRQGKERKYGVTRPELTELSALLRKEFALIKGSLDSDAKRFPM